MKGININCKKKDWIGLILTGEKTIETRDSMSLHPYIGQRIGLVATGRGKATLHGYATIKKVVEYRSLEDWNKDMSKHLVMYTDPYCWEVGKTKLKWGYVLTDVERCEPRIIETKGIVAREI